MFNPNWTVLVLRDDDGPALWETGAILRYLAGRYGDDAIWPRDPLTRADVDRWTEWANLNVAMAFAAPVFWRIVRTPAHRQDAAAIAQAVQALEHRPRIAEQSLGNTRRSQARGSPAPTSSSATCCIAPTKSR
ncbi:glutathione S-transferase [Alloyangia pacifica]|uniref:Glutathione S-transferase n=1 Tax=Alloyangia pacifica TaxID=311180 RepID=A0A1I6W248_9RHOB|nr:glutathione S-transferase family protein [Alloyangia pacifica]SDI38534.1 glutathione S-transferase [Alloyangia pacifica]SFT20053.1 glutathione S-transferase [Alloyangia pacifica]